VSLTNPQKALLKQAQRQALIGDEEYRDALEIVTHLPGCRSSTDSRMMDGHLDALMAFFEAVYWRSVDAGTAAAPVSVKQPFRQRGYWASKNRKGDTSRDRFAGADLEHRIKGLQADLALLGYGLGYCAAILRASGPGWPYAAALKRTLAAKQRAGAGVAGEQKVGEDPF
jgi:hypothetical protein